MSRANFSVAEKVSIAGIAALLAWQYVLPHRANELPTKVAAVTRPSNEDAISANNPKSMVPASELLAGLTVNLAAGRAITSREGDPCKVIRATTTDLAPKNHKAGLTRKDVRIYCKAKPANYAVDNIGIYRKGKLISSSRKKIVDGQCHFIKMYKDPIAELKNGEYRSMFYGCYLGGKIVVESVAGIFQAGKPVSLHAALRNPASVLRKGNQSK